MNNPKDAANRILKRARKARAMKRPWNWDGQKKPGEYVRECSTLGETVIQKTGDWDGDTEDCAYVATVCQDAPAVAQAYLDLLKILRACPVLPFDLSKAPGLEPS